VNISFHQQLDWVRSGTELFETTVAGVGDSDLAEPSGLPDWSRAHVTAHVANNADAIVNLLTWARTGVETPMYRSRAVRDADIEAGAALPPGALRERLRDAHARLAAELSGLPEDRRTALVRTNSGRTIPAAEVPWMRVCELWIHTVDLDAGVTFADLPRPLLVALVDDAAGRMGARDGIPHVRLEPTDLEERWELGSGEAPVAVGGAAGDLAAYLLGRPVRGELRTGGQPVPPPPLPPWA
jgi:maleylpyruvate isomerase